jgi:hypothetical protein
MYRLSSGRMFSGMPNDDQMRLIVCANEIALVHHERACSPGKRCADGRVLELHLRVFHRGGIRTHRRFERCGRCQGGVPFCARADSAFDEVVEALGNGLRITRLGEVATQVRLGLAQRGLERAPVQREQHLSGLHIIALTKIYRGQLAGNLRPDGDTGKGLGGAYDVDLERHRLDGDRRNRYGDSSLAALPWLLRFGTGTRRERGCGSRNRAEYEKIGNPHRSEILDKGLEPLLTF